MRRTSRQDVWLGAMLLSLLLVAFGCEKRHDDNLTNPRDPGQGGVSPPTVTDLQVEVGNRVGSLTWSLEDSSSVASVVGYTVWLRPVGSIPYDREDSVGAPPGRLSGMLNGVPYEVAVRPVMASGVQGILSHDLRFTTGLYSVLIEDGREKTRSTTVLLGLQAPAGSQGVRLSSQADLTNVAVAPFREAATWALDPLDGVQRVYAQFVNAEGTFSTTVFDEIILDTQASITELNLTPTSGLVRPGDSVTFEMNTEEARGTAWIIIGQDGRRKDLRDDGTGGDATAEDGIYTLDYIVEGDLRVVDALVIGNFVDSAENQADPRVAAERLTVDAAPTPVTLNPATSPTPTSLQLTWSQALEGEVFSEYRLIRATAPDVMNRPDRQIRATITDRSRSEFNDTNLEPGRTYYYVVQVMDVFGTKAESNEISAQAQVNEPPSAVTLFDPTGVTESRAAISWSQSAAPDFAFYRIVRGTDPNPLSDPDRVILQEIRDVAQTNLEDIREIEQGVTYFYVVEVVDVLGLSAPSNVVSAAIPNSAPIAADLIEPVVPGETSLTLRWTRSPELDFAAYRLYRSATSGVGEANVLVADVDRVEVTQWLDSGLIENTTYYYRVFVADKGGLTTGGSEVAVTTANADPQAVTLASLVEDEGAFETTILVDWTQSAAHDFQRYTIYRDTSPGVTPASPVVRDVLDALVSQAEDTALQDNTRYSYRVFVYDDKAAFAGSNELVITTKNRPPTPVSLTVTGSGAGSVSLIWNQSAAHDFQSYQLYRGTTSTSFPTLVGTWTDRAQTAHSVSVLPGDETLYFFRLTLRDRGLTGNPDDSSLSNVVSARGWEPAGP